jgi:hypothetical protein
MHTRSFETSVDFQRTTLRFVPEDQILEWLTKNWRLLDRGAMVRLEGLGK